MLAKDLLKEDSSTQRPHLQSARLWSDRDLVSQSETPWRKPASDALKMGIGTLSSWREGQSGMLNEAAFSLVSVKSS